MARLVCLCLAVCLSTSATSTLGFGSRPGFAHRFCLALAPASASLSLPARPASTRRPVLPYAWEREKLPFLPLPLDPGNFLLSQAVPSPVPSAFGGLTSVFGMGTGGSPPAIVTGNFLAPAPSKLHRSELTSKLHTLEVLFRSSQRFHSPLPRFLSLPDQALDRLVSPSSTRYRASTGDLSTSSSLRGLTCFKQWQSSSSGGLHA